MSSYEHIDVIPFEPPYTNQESIERIQDNIGRMAHNKLPIFQVDVGHDIHLAGTLAVRHIIEQAYGEFTNDAYREADFPRFAFWFQNMRTPYYTRVNYATPHRLAPHTDRQQVGPAIHKEYPGQPTVVQGGYKRYGCTLLPINDNATYEGPGVDKFVETAYHGVAQLGRLTVFSQGDPVIGMRQAVHYFEREPGQAIGGRYVRYHMVDPAVVDFSKVRSYEELVAMREQTSLHLDYEQWRHLDYMLSRNSSEDYAQWKRLAAQQLVDHPGKGDVFWQRMIEGNHIYSYGVTSAAYPEEDKEHFMVYPRYNSKF